MTAPKKRTVEEGRSVNAVKRPPIRVELLEHQPVNLYFVAHAAQAVHRGYKIVVHITNHGIIANVNSRQFCIPIAKLADQLIDYVENNPK